MTTYNNIDSFIFIYLWYGSSRYSSFQLWKYHQLNRRRKTSIGILFVGNTYRILWLSLSVTKKILPLVLHTEIVRKKKNSSWKYTDGFIPSVIVAYPVNIFQHPVKCRRTVSLCKFVGECGISTTLCEMPTNFIRL